jgi:hypothetical protein
LANAAGVKLLLTGHSLGMVDRRPGSPCPPRFARARNCRMRILAKSNRSPHCVIAHRMPDGYAGSRIART